MAAKGPSMRAQGPTKMVAPLCPIQRLSGLFSNCYMLALSGSKGQAIHQSESGVFNTPDVTAAQQPAPPAINLGGEETTGLLLDGK